MVSLKEKWDSPEWRSGKTVQSENVQDNSKGKGRKMGADHHQSLPIDKHRSKILDHIMKNRVTFIQGDPGCGKSTAVPQFILDDNRFRAAKVVVTQPRRIAAISLAKRVAQMRNQLVGDEVGYCVSNDHITGGEHTRLLYMTSGYLLEWLGCQWDKTRPLQECMSHLILDEVHEGNAQQELLMLMVKKLLHCGQKACSASTGFPKIIIMSATLQVKPFRDYFAPFTRQFSISKRGGSRGPTIQASESLDDTLHVGAYRFSVDIVFLEEILKAIPTLGSAGKEIVRRLLKFPANGESFPSFAYSLVVHLVSQTAQAGDAVLVFVPGMGDIVRLQEEFRRKSSGAGDKRLELYFLHSLLEKEEQAAALQPPSPGAAKVVLSTDLAESSITIPGVRFVIDMGMTKSMTFDKSVGVHRLSCSWCTKASATQRAGRVGRLYPGTVFRLYTREMYDHFQVARMFLFSSSDTSFQDYTESKIREQEIQYALIKLLSNFTAFGPPIQLVQETMVPPEPTLVVDAMRALRSSGALMYSDHNNFHDAKLTALGRLAKCLAGDVKVAKLVLNGLVLNCSPDCVVMAAAPESDKEDIFHRYQIHQCQSDPLKIQNNLCESFKTRKRFDRGHYSELLIYRQVYIEGQRNQFTRKWLEQNHLSSPRFELFTRRIAKFASHVSEFLQTHNLSEGMSLELQKLTLLARHGKGYTLDSFIFREDLTMVKLAITAAFTDCLLVGEIANSRQAVNESIELQKAGLLPSVSFKLNGIESAPVNVEELGKVLQVVGPFARIVPSPTQNGAALIQCYNAGSQTNCYDSVVQDLPQSCLLLFRLPRASASRRATVVHLAGQNGCSERHIGRPSKSRQIGWSTILNGRTVKVKCEQSSILEPAFEMRTRGEVNFHLAVARQVLGTTRKDKVTAQCVTLLPSQNLFSVLAILLCWPPGEHGLELRMDTRSQRVYCIRIGPRLNLSLAPRYLILKQLDLIEVARIKMHRVLAGEMVQGNLEMDIRMILMADTNQKHQAVMSPQLGPWVRYPFMISSEECKVNISNNGAKHFNGVHKGKARNAARQSVKSVASLDVRSEESAPTKSTNTVQQKKVYIPKCADEGANRLQRGVNDVHMSSDEAVQSSGQSVTDAQRPLLIFATDESYNHATREKVAVLDSLLTEDMATMPHKLFSTAPDRLQEEFKEALALADMSLDEIGESSEHAGSEARELRLPVEDKAIVRIESGDKATILNDLPEVASTVTPDIQTLLTAFQLVDPSLSLQMVHDWTSGERSHNQKFFSLLRELVLMYHSTEGESLDCDVPTVVEIVHKEKRKLVNNKQQMQVETWYHSVCNPDKSKMMPLTAWGTAPREKVRVDKQDAQSFIRQPSATTISKELSLTLPQRSFLLQKLKSQPVPEVDVFIPDVASKSSLVMVFGEPLQVETALGWIRSTVLEHTPGKWRINQTYMDSQDSHQSIRFVAISQTRNRLLSEFVVQLAPGLRSPLDVKAPSLYLPEISRDFGNVLQRVRSGTKVEMQGRLGRVVFCQKKSQEIFLPYDVSRTPNVLIRLLTEKKVHKQRFDDAIQPEEFGYLRSALAICRPKKIFRHQSIILQVSSLQRQSANEGVRKLTIVESDSRPGKHILQLVQHRERLAAADIVRLHVGAVHADIRLCMTTTVQKGVTKEDQEFVDGIERRGAILWFPPHYVVHTKRLKEMEVFLFHELKVSLAVVTQARGEGDSVIKHEVEFEVVDPNGDGSTSFLSPESVRERMEFLLREIQSMCTELSLKFDETITKDLAGKLLLHWKMQHGKSPQLRKLLELGLSANPEEKDGDSVHQSPAHPVSQGYGRNTNNSELVCDLVEHLHHFDGCITAKDDVAATELLIAVLQTLHSMKFLLATGVQERAWMLITSSELKPKVALWFASLVSRDCYSKHHWEDVLCPYLWQMELEQQHEEADELILLLGLQKKPMKVVLNDLARGPSLNNIFCSLRRLIHTNNAPQFMAVFSRALEQQSAIPPRHLEENMKKVLCHHESRGAKFVLLCSEWFLQSSESEGDTDHKSSLLWLIGVIKTLNVPISEECRLLALSQLMEFAPVEMEAQDIEEKIFSTYQVDEALYRNEHYQRILKSLSLSRTHINELVRRGLAESQCHMFKTLHPGHRVKASCLIPGVNRGGDKLIGSPGILIPARDPTGQITGAQIKVDKVNSGKYIWWSSKNEGGRGPRVRESLPLFCCIPEGHDCAVIGLCEGGLKAHVAAALSGLPMIGASGAAFPQSRSLLETYLAMLKPAQILFFPDAGSTSNDQVTRSYFHTFRLLREWNYNFVIAWWGQVNKEDHLDIDDFLCTSESAEELSLLSVRQFWQLINPDVKTKLDEEFSELSKPWEVRVQPQAIDLEETFTDTDDIKITRIPASIESVHTQKFLISIPKARMTRMPNPPNGYVTPSSVKTFSIEASMVSVNNLQEIDLLVEWLMQGEKDDKAIIGLDCEHDPDGTLRLIQLSVHSRCLLIRVPFLTSRHLFQAPIRLSRLLASVTYIKTGAEVHKDALAIFHTLGLVVNGCKNVSHVYRDNNRTNGMLQIFRDLYGWDWKKEKSVSCSHWGGDYLSLEQIKYAVIDAWASRMLSLQGRAAEEGAIPLVSLQDVPVTVLDIFARSISHSDTLKKEEKVIEGEGNIMALNCGALRLQQIKFRSRVLGIKSSVEIKFKDGQEPKKYAATARTGKTVTLRLISTSAPTFEADTKESGQCLDVSSISSIVVDNRKHANKAKKKLEEALYGILCAPAKCPALLLRALHCSNTQRDNVILKEWTSTHSRVMALQHISGALNNSQRKAWEQILTSDVSATIGPPGTGKTRLIAAVTQAWHDLADEGHVFLCTAVQNVATRHVAETLVRQQVPGVMLLISQDYYMEWHEHLYKDIKEFVIMSAARSDLLSSLHIWAVTNKRKTPRILICTLSSVGSQAFNTSLMGGKVTMMLVDECSQAAEGSILAPLVCLPNLQQIGVMGDPYQLPPFSGRQTQANSVYDLMATGCIPTLLEEQYRMPPAICDFISCEFYKKKLRTAPIRERQKGIRTPLLWVNVKGHSTVLPGKTSLTNKAEANAIITFCKSYSTLSAGNMDTQEPRTLPTNNESQEAGNMSLVVLTLYEEQRHLISSLMRESNLEFQVHNVDSFQGQEAETVLISLVVADKISHFAADPHRACVILSRASKLMCIFGNLSKVVDNPRAEVWRRLALHCQHHDFILQENDVQSVVEETTRRPA